MLSAILASLLVTVCFTYSMTSLYIASCTSARSINGNKGNSSSLQYFSSLQNSSLHLHCLLPSSTDYLVSKRYPRDLEASQITYTPYHYLQKIKYSVTKNQLHTLEKTIAQVLNVWPETVTENSTQLLGKLK